jgi:hypothetical protein
MNTKLLFITIKGVYTKIQNFREGQSLQANAGLVTQNLLYIVSLQHYK